MAPAKDGVGLDGIAFGADGNLYVTTYIPAALFKITVKDGKAGAVTALRSSRPLDHADAMRGFGDSLLLIEGNGKLDKITIKGDDAEIENNKNGFTRPSGRRYRVGCGGKSSTSSATIKGWIPAHLRSAVPLSAGRQRS